MMVEENYLCKFRKIDALRLYGGDTRERNSDGGIGGNSKDPMYGDKDAYRTLNRSEERRVGKECT